MFLAIESTSCNHVQGVQICPSIYQSTSVVSDRRLCRAANKAVLLCVAECLLWNKEASLWVHWCLGA